MEVYPTNFPERLFCLITVLFAMVAFSSFLSMLTSTWLQLRNKVENESRQFWLLRRYLKELNISRATSVRVLRYVEHAWARRQEKVQEQDVALLCMLSQSLAEEVKLESVASYIEVHTLFSSLGESSKVFMCALQSYSLANGDTYFICGQKAEAMIFVVEGTLRYSLHDEDDYEESFECQLSARQWICEAVLWTPWVHLGDLQAEADGLVITIDRARFSHVVKKDVALWFSLSAYGRCFIQELNQISRSALSDLLDRQFLPKSILRKCNPNTCDNASTRSSKSPARTLSRTLSRQISSSSLASEAFVSGVGHSARNLWFAIRRRSRG